MIEDLPTLPFEAIREHLDNLILAVSNKLEREWKDTKWNSNSGAAVTLRATVLVAGNTYNSIRFLCADKPPDVSRKLEYGLSVLPLARTILDSVFTIIFLFENLPAHQEWFSKSGWREALEENKRYEEKYGSDPDWADYLSERATFLDVLKKDAGITPAEEANPQKTIPWWPNPGKMINHTNISKATSDYMRFLNDWFYKHLSAASHLSWPGLARRSAAFFAPDDQREPMLIKMRSDAVMTTITLVVALLSEVQIGVDLNISSRLKYLWGILFAYWGAAKDLYEMRYEKLL